MRQPQLGGSKSQLAPVPVLGRKARGTKTVTIPGVGTATYTLPEWRSVRRMLKDAKTEYTRNEAEKIAMLIHEAKVVDPGCLLVTGPDDERPLPDELGEQMRLS